MASLNLKLLVLCLLGVVCWVDNVSLPPFLTGKATPSVIELDSNVGTKSDNYTDSYTDTSKLEIATLAGGCFWKMDACYRQLRGVEKVEVGYAGGQLKNPTYEQVCSRTTGHAETVQVSFDPKVTNFREILEVFWTIHDASKLNQEEGDTGTDYRSVVFYRNENQQKIAKIVKDSLEKKHFYTAKIVTAIEPFKNFYRAEAYHQNYYNLHPTESYTYNVVRRKVELFEHEFASKRKNP